MPFLLVESATTVGVFFSGLLSHQYSRNQIGVQIPAPPLTSCVLLCKLINF